MTGIPYLAGPVKKGPINTRTPQTGFWLRLLRRLAVEQRAICAAASAAQCGLNVTAISRAPRAYLSHPGSARRPDRSVMRFVPFGSVTDIQRCQEVRADAESAAAGWAAQRRDERDLVALERAHQHREIRYLQQALGVDADQ
jgi:hypothetical protein